MIFQVGIENNNEGRSIAWALERPHKCDGNNEQQQYPPNDRDALP